MVTRRAVMAGSAGLILAGCSQTAKTGSAKTLAEAVAGSWRPAADRARDPWRHPVESLEFWGVKPGATVVEFWPGAGWYTDIIAPFLADTGGKLYAANVQGGDPADTAAARLAEAYERKVKGDRKLYGSVTFTEFGPTSEAVAPAGKADVVLFLRNLHNWISGQYADKAFRDAFAALKPGGKLGIEEHRAGAEGGLLAADGYVQEVLVKQLAAEAGFVFEAASEINANLLDTKDHPFGVWTLPPTRLSAPRGDPPNPNFEHEKYDEIGESDRMTLRFVKPVSK